MISVRKLVSEFQKSDFYKQSIPVGMAAGWPCIRRLGKNLCITIPYYSRFMHEKKVLLNAIYCSVTFPIEHPQRLMDFTIYPHQRGWEDVDYEKPVGYFPHEALAGVCRSEYKEMCHRLYAYYDKMLDAERNGKPFQEEEEMALLFTKLMEPAHYPQYLRIQKKFYSSYCKL